MTRAAPAATESLRVATPSGEVAVSLAGEGATLLCLHGIGSSATAFGPLLDDPPRGWRVAAWDAPGYGRSDDPPAAPEMADFALAARRVVEALGTGPAVVVGVSWGGVVATRLALDARDLVAGLVLVSSSVGSGAEPARAAGMRARADDLARLGATRFASERGPRLLSPQATEAQRSTVVGSMARAIRLPGYGWAAEAMAATDHTPSLARISAPTLVVAGSLDDVTGPADSEPLVAGIPGAALRTVPGAGHLVNQEQPVAFAALLHDFLSTLTPAPGGRP